jgi:hypothetical protein
MNRALSLFEERKSEIEFYYSILQDIEPLTEKPKSKIETIDNARFERILKSNFFLMLYNLIEACVTTGFIEIYEAIENHGKAYVDLIAEFQKIWSDYKISEPAENTANQGTYKKIVRNILSDVLARKPLEFQTSDQIKFTKNILHVGGNLDAREIRDLLTTHNIAFADQSDKHKMLTVKQKRNALAHGEESFGDSARDFSVIDLEDFKDEVLSFIADVLNTMQEYYEAQRYIAAT